MAQISEQPTGKQSSTNDLAGKYLTFHLAGEEYGLEILKVREIIGMLEITTVPQTPEFMQGVINLRGKVIPVLDLRLRFGLPYREPDDRTSIVVVESVSGSGQPTLMGLVVDAVNEVANVAAEEIDPTPSFGGDMQTDYILGMAKVGGSVKILLDIDRILRDSQLVLGD